MEGLAEVGANAQVVLRALDAWNARDVEGFLAFADPGIDVVFPPDVPEPGPFHGRDQLRGWVEGFLAAWDEFEVRADGLLELADAVVVLLWQRGRGRGTGIEIQTTDAHVFRLRDGQIRHWRNHRNRTEALAAVGLPGDSAFLPA